MRGRETGGLLQHQFVTFPDQSEDHRAEPVSGVSEFGVRSRLEISVDDGHEHAEIPPDDTVGNAPFL